MLSGILNGFLRNFRTVVSGRRLWWHILAIALTYGAVVSGSDWWFYEHTRSPLFDPIIWAAGIGGFFIPVLVPLGMYVWGERTHSRSLMKAAAAVAQAVIIAWILIAIYKVFTGRVQPEFMNTIGNTDISRDFQFGFLRNGIFWGWPSSHTAVAFAGGIAFMRLVNNVYARSGAVLYMAIVATGAGIGFHWFSDVLAGVILGVLIGHIVANTVRQST